MDPPVEPARSRLMGRVRGRHTKPEMIVRRMLHALGYRFRLHRRDLPGSPDVVLPSCSTALFVHGCFWHRHRGCRLSSTPKTRREFWEAKFARNVKRDAANASRLQDLGWRVIVVWECETKDPDSLRQRLCKELGAPGRGTKIKE
ncbi:MAG: DNA mismatch endonuclease Vsr [bacterium]|nr:DNA mismatch endonuclease Vsr [bacterium]